jgi:radical SAM superfamily enzyme YgiQ (UPF0313 family)
MSRRLPIVTADRRPPKIVVVGFAGFLRDYTVTNFRMPRIGPVMVGTVLQAAGYSVRVYAESVRALDREALTRICNADVVAMGVLTYGANRAYALADLIRRVNPRARIVMGDVHPTIMPEHALQHCDFVVRGEGEQTILELVGHLTGRDGAPPPSEILGLSWWNEGRIVHNPERPRPEAIDVELDLSLVEGFVQPDTRTLREEQRYTMSVVQASRGCPVGCSFCLGSKILGRSYRTKGIDRVISELHRIRRYAISRTPVVFFVDNHLFIDRPWTKALLRRIIAERLNFKLIGFGQYFVGRDPEMLDLLREAGFFRIFVGFESINPATLQQYKKRQSEQTMRECIAKMHAHGIEIHGSFMLGGEADTLATVEATIRFAIDTEIMTASFFGLCEYPFEPHPFVPDTSTLPPQRRLPDNLDFYNLNFVSIYPRLMRPSQLQRALIDCHERFYAPTRVFTSLRARQRQRAWYRFVGHLAQRGMVAQMRNHLPYLEAHERGKYDAHDRLREEALSRTPIRFRNPTPRLYDDTYYGRTAAGLLARARTRLGISA